MHKTWSARLFVALAVLTGVAALPAALTAATDKTADRPSLLRLKPADLHAVVLSLADEGYDIFGVDLENGTVDVAGTSADVAAFAKRGIPVTVVRYLDAQPQVDPKYADPAEVEERLEHYQARYPGIAHL